MEDTKINWARHTFNAWKGCTRVDHECTFCYAENLIDQRYGANLLPIWGQNGERPKTIDANWKHPYRWNKEAQEAGETRFVFCGSLMDFAEDNPKIKPEWREQLIEMIRNTPNLTWLLLSKRPENFPKYLPAKPLPNVWLGTSAGHGNESALGRIKALQGLPVAKGCHRFISAEPLLEKASAPGRILPLVAKNGTLDLSGISWLICGGESGSAARPFDIAAAYRVFEQCRAQGVKFWFKQVGDFTMDSETFIETHKDIHNLSYVPQKYRKMIVRERPAGVKVRKCVTKIHSKAKKGAVAA
ncbi:DUF5131 family protein [Granulicella sp. dw_53]|uniref:DUF5131 family protein n=1 Tax=Granulicella sp. dw_53 TaxID=2719792 RepID=UPI001BD2B7EF|nr:DUF5131 family protein [Granulicella sp. dw_53]